MEMVIDILILNLSDTNINFVEQKLIWRNYTIVEALYTTNQVKFIDKREFADIAIVENSETFVIHMAILEVI